jgi:hypothetical protein
MASSLGGMSDVLMWCRSPDTTAAKPTMAPAMLRRAPAPMSIAPAMRAPLCDPGCVDQICSLATVDLLDEEASLAAADRGGITRRG